MHMQGMRHIIRVPYVDLQPLARSRVYNRTRNAMRVERFIDIGSDQFVRFGNEISGIKVFAIYNCGQRPGVDLSLRNQSILVSVAAHAVPAILNWWHSLFLRFDWTVVLNPFNF